MSNMEDGEIIERAVQGDTEAFSVLYEKNVERIYNYIFFRTGNHHDAEDLTSRVFFRALEHISSYRAMGVPFSAWLYRIAHNLVANWYRDKKRKRELPLEDYVPMNQSTTNLPEHAIMKSQDNEKLLKAIRDLSNDRQQLLILKYIEKLSNAEIAIIMGRSEGAIKSLYHRTVMMLRKVIDEEK